MTDKKVGVIGGSGFYSFPELTNVKVQDVDTAFGKVTDVVEGDLDGGRIVFLARHGNDHTTPPHRVNYRANIAALEMLGVDYIVAFNAIGGISPGFSNGMLVIPDQLIDYTYGREHTFFDGFCGELSHVDFTDPFDMSLRAKVLNVLSEIELPHLSSATYGCVQGPRLETAAEIKRMQRDGCDVVGMTAMPEAALAREKEIPYCMIALVVNPAAGIEAEAISLDKIMALLNSFIPKIREVIRKTLRFI